MLPIKQGFLALTMLMSACLGQAMTSNQLALVHENNDFRVENLEGSFPIQRCYIDKELRGISAGKLAKLTTAGAYLQLNKLDGADHEYTLKLNGRLNGGGVFLANTFYWGVKAIGYGVPATVAVTSVVVAAAPLVAAGGAAGAAAGAASATSSLAIGATSSAAIGSVAATAGAVTTTAATAGGTTVTCLLASGAGAAAAGGAIAGEALIGAVGLEAAATGTAAVLGGGTTVGSYVTAVEVTATAAFGAGLAVWWLP